MKCRLLSGSPLSRAPYHYEAPFAHIENEVMQGGPRRFRRLQQQAVALVFRVPRCRNHAWERQHYELRLAHKYARVRVHRYGGERENAPIGGCLDGDDGGSAWRGPGTGHRHGG
jgi:hypothetical protein